jgi:hypothetical protein
MTKGGGFACGACRHPRADVHLGLVDQAPIHEPCYPWSAWGTGHGVPRRLPALATGCNPLAPGGTVHVGLCLGLALPQWLRATLGALRHRLASARPLLPLEHRCQGELAPPRGLACALRPDIPPRVTARVQRLGPPSPQLRPCACRRAAGGLAQDPAALRPHAGVPDLRAGSARRAARAAGPPPRLRTAPAAVLMVAGRHRATTAREPPRATAAAAAAYIRLGGMGAAGHVPLTLQAVRGRCAGRVADAGGHRPGHPLLRGGWLWTRARSPRREGGWAPTGRRGAAAAPGGDARGGRRAPQAPYRGDRPPCAPPGRGTRGLPAALRPFRPAWRLPGRGLPGTHVLHHGSLDGGKAYAAGSARAGGLTQSALGGSRPRQKLATAPCGVAPSAPALGHQGPLVRGHSGADVSQEWIRRLITPGALDTRDTAAPWGEGIDPAPLRHRVPCEAIGRRPPHACNGGQRGPVSESVTTGTRERGAPGAVIAIDRLVGHRPRRLARHGGVPAAAWVRHRLRLGRTTGRDTPGERDCQGSPPADAMAQGACLRSVPSPMAAGTGRHHPTVVHRHGVLGLSGVQASRCACVPPAYVQDRTQEETPTTGAAAEP